MIINKIMGRLGNQMFQWAFGKNLSMTTNLELRLETSWFSHSPWNNEFKINQFPNLELKKVEGTESILNTIREPHNFSYVKIPTVAPFTIFEGYWQNEMYFKENKDTIVNDFAMTSDKRIELVSKYPMINENSVCLHFRRGDYVGSYVHPILPMEYYFQALDYIGNYDSIVVFSDEIEWCKKNFKLPKITYVDNLNNLDSLWLMSLGTNNIIANSSLSWWGAYLNPNQNKKIIAPKKWFGEHSGIDSTSICPYDWIII